MLIMSSFNNMIFSALLLVLLFSNSFNPCIAQLSTTFYDTSCPTALSTIRPIIRQAVQAERRMGGSLIRLHFHDCFVQGCDGSILLDEAPGIESEKTSLANNNSVRGFDVINNAKRAVENVCPGVVSCADILTLAARDAAVALAVPSWTVRLGRRDSTTASRTLADSDLPNPFSTLAQLVANFARKGFNLREMVALSGSHTLGQARCAAFRARIYNATNIDAGFASTRRRQCPPTAPAGNNNLAPLDLVTPNSFDNNYYKNLMQLKGLLTSDQVLFDGGSADSIVDEYSRNPATFLADFGAAMVKMGEIGTLTGTNGIIRKVCSAIN